ncbi:MAG: SgcJ/EcaC family oxidoreductase [Acidimicrobiia bacterium]
MGAETPEQVGELMEAAYRAKNVEAVADLYEEDAIFAAPDAGFTAIGRAAIVDRVTEMFAAMPELETVYDPPELSAVVGNHAFFHYTSSTRFSLSDGAQREMRTRTTTIAHRGADGFWRFVLDHSSAP